MPRFPFLLLLTIATPLAGCRANTNRPSFLPHPEALQAEVRMGIAEGTRVLAEALRADRVPVTRVEELDGYVESPWFVLEGDAGPGRPVDTRPVGQGVLRVRGWIDPAKPGYVRFTTEIVYRPWIDPGRPGRDLDTQVPTEHAMSKAVAARFLQLVERYGDPLAPGPAGTTRP